MDLSSAHLNGLWPFAHWIYWPFLLLAIWRAPWAIIRQRDSSNILFATCTAIFLLWHLRIQLVDGLALHLLGATVLTLMFRWQVAIMANAILVVGITLTTSADFAAFATNALITGVLPITLSYAVWRLNEWYLPPNYFVYIFVAAFLCGGVSILCSGFFSYQLLSMATESSLSSEQLNEHLMVFIPMMYPEAFLTGALISVFVIYKPQWIATFDDRRYLHRR